MPHCPNEGQKDVKQGTLAGEDWPLGGRLKLVSDGFGRQVLVDGKPYMSWSVEDKASQRMAIAQIHRAGIASQQELARVFGVHVKSVGRYVQAFGAQGLSGLVSSRSGPKESWRVNRWVRGQVLLIALKYDIVDCEAIRQRMQTWFGEDLSSSSIRRILMENGVVEGSTEGQAAMLQHSLPFEDSDQGQLQLGLFGTGQSEIDRQGVADKEGQAENGKQTTVTCEKDEVQNPRRSYSRSQRIYLDRLEQGEYNSYAGGLLLIPLLAQYALLPTLRSIIAMDVHEGYSFEQLCLTLLYMNVFGFRSLEDFKRAYREEFGILVGRAYSPSHFSLRRFLHKVRVLEKGEELIERFADEYLRTGIARWGVIYIDGHFFPYSGMHLIKKGFHGVRKIAMKGSYHFLGVDEEFTPWIFLVRSSAEDLLQKIPEIIEKAKRLAGVAGIPVHQVDDLIVVFDREGYSAELYRYLDGRDEDSDDKRRAIFISWAKYSEWAYEIPDEQFERKVVVRYKIQKPKEFKYCTTQRMMKKYGTIRSIVVERAADGRRAVIYTNGSENELTTERAVRLICRRWGEENVIKALMDRHKINYTPGYVMKEMGKQPAVDNPQVVELKKRKAVLVGNLRKLKVKFTDKILKETNDETKLEEIKKTQLRLLEDIVTIENQILLMDLEIDKLPKEVRFEEAHRGRRLLRQDYEKKRFLDCLKVFTHNMEMKMCGLLLNHYDANKELFPALSMILGRGGYVKLEGGELSVRLKRFKNRAIDYAARHLCEDLNEMEPVTLDKFGLRIRYQVT